MKTFFFSRLFRASETVAGAAFIIAVLSIASRVLGMLRDRILASTFGAGETLDMYYAAFRLPDLIFNLLILGALSAGFIPVFSQLLARRQETDAWKLASNILTILGVALTVICGLGMIFAPTLVSLIVPGFEGEAQATIAKLTRIMFLSPFLLGLSSIVGGMLQSFQRFFVYSLSPIFYNLSIIFGALFLTERCGVEGLAWGVVIGSLLHLAIQLPALFRLGFRYEILLEWRDRGVRQIFSMMGARTLGLAVTQINLMIMTVIASTLVSGSLSVFNLANNLQSFPVGIFGISFAMAAFPLMSAAADKRDKLIGYFSKSFRQIMFCIIPATVIMLALRAQIVRLVLGAGKFDWTATGMTVETLGFFAISFFAQAALPLLTRAFYAQHDSKTPFFIGVVAEVANIGLALWLIGSFGVAGLALAFSVSSVLNFLLLFVFLHRRLGTLDEGRIVRSIFKSSVAALCAGIAIQAMKLLVWPATGDLERFSGVLLQAAAAGTFGLLVYLGVCSLLKSEEFIEVWAALKRRVGKSARNVAVEDQAEARGI